MNQKQQESIMIDHATNGKFGADIELIVEDLISEEGLIEFKDKFKKELNNKEIGNE
jgi:hypothetical protein